MSETLKIVLAFAVSVIIAFLVTPVIKKIAVKFNIMDIPKDNRKLHKTPIPYLGGVAIFIGFIVSISIFLNFDKQITGLVIGGSIILLIGMIDDIFDVTPIIKFIGQLIAVFIVIRSGIVIPKLSHHIFIPGSQWIELSEIWSYILTFLWIAGMTNAVNLIDGLDGLAAGVSAIAALSLLGVSIFLPGVTYTVLVIAVTLAGACIGFLPHNFNPAKIFMGDSGSMFLGFVLGSLSVIGPFKTITVVSFLVPVIILALPIFDTSFAILRRVVTKQKITVADKNHVHHRLLQVGFSHRKAVIILYIFTAILGLMAIVLTGTEVVRIVVLISLVLLFIFFGIRYLYSMNNQKKDKGENINEED